MSLGQKRTSIHRLTDSLLLLLHFLTPDDGPLSGHTVSQEETDACVGELEHVPRAVVLALGPLRIGEGLADVLEAVDGVARSVVGSLGSLIPPAVVHGSSLHLSAPVHGLLSVLLRGSESLLGLLVGEEDVLPLHVLLDAVLESIVFGLDLVLLDSLGQGRPDLVLVAGDHLIQDAASSGSLHSRAQHGGKIRSRIAIKME
mmetsp:Transcript_29198/g.44113  ORF Transcript_29198/g.44113 Transcript_29198/m.44113 type:complete len:201 (-) Transcript_29198:37-639(-)